MTEHQPGRRLDQILVDRGFVDTRSRARDLILRGFVLVSGSVEKRPARKVAADLDLAVHSAAPQFVSRGAEKLAAALNHFSYDPDRKTGLDIGASTGGFTQVLLERGAERVIAVDVGRAQLHATLRDDPRVTVLEQTDARQLNEDQLGSSVDCLVVDLSFVSAIKVLPFVIDFVRAGGFAVVLIKPQFEVGSEFVGKGGIVRDETARNGAVQRVRDWLAAQAGWHIDGVIQSPISGGSGNIEYLLGARKLG